MGLNEKMHQERVLMLKVNLLLARKQYYEHSIYNNKYINTKGIFQSNVLHVQAKQYANFKEKKCGRCIQNNK